MLLIRHAITDLAGTLCGQSDPPLNDEGRQQAQRLAETLRPYKLQRVYASTLKRAVETATPLLSPGVALIQHPDLQEINFGDWEGKRWADVRDTGPDLTTLESHPDMAPPGGETFHSFRTRVLNAFHDITLDGRTTPSALVTHLGVIRVLMNSLYPDHPDWDPRRRMDYCAIFSLNT